ncbi:RNA polymerase sigma factor [Flexithrix dorotheae]|uniref:RNA polymerase sigma factor n=1 Tax=Flexithrix dorotheae TaxID=70993 RepID=UPI00035D87AB|nr:sigma-70 family RNA polymerase sigma factor [Flexithrix dorotheae]
MENLNLWKEFKEGNQTAFAEIFNQNIRILYKYGSKFTPNGEIVEDCIQDLFLDLWRNRKTIGETDSIKNYLLGALRRRIIRKTQKSKQLNTEMELENYDFQLEINTEDHLIKEELQQEGKDKLKGAMANLSKRQKEAIYMKYFHEMNYDEISKALNINYQSARNLIYGGLKALKENIKYLKIIMIFFFIKF